MPSAQERRLLFQLGHHDIGLAHALATLASGARFVREKKGNHLPSLVSTTRALRQIKFQSNPDTLESKTRAFVVASQVFARAEARVDDAHFFLKVALQVARSSPHMSYWLTVAKRR